MLVTVANVSGAAINYLTVGEDGVSTGGSRTKPLPYPFSHIGTLAAASSKQLAMQPADWHHKSSIGAGMEPATEWNQLVQAGIVTLAYAAETGRRDSEELFIDAI
jgi:hypothetical protein